MIARPSKAGRSLNARSAARAARLRAALKSYRKFSQHRRQPVGGSGRPELRLEDLEDVGE